MQHDHQVSRRASLAAGGAALVVAGMAPLASADTGRQARAHRVAQSARSSVSTGRTSANGWPMEKGSDLGGAIWTRPVPGTRCEVAWRLAEVELVLSRVVRRFHYEVLPLEPGDVVGYRDHRRVGRGPESNHASGTAIDLLPGGLPPGARHLTFDQAKGVREIVGDCEGVVTWGGDQIVPSESHFHIAVGPDDPRLIRLAARIRVEEELPSTVVGVTL